ncbi:hypothetical protein H072_4637 [Dactylellina haptotyla CBS 200.50]|uniref:Uncharacterized protein n=1 Tax=Dactylellina haptotyla (strain CBS 200.50) TaxID=1284197 RepID=S8C1K7_DACHA|nr:hypothetical protein H072_4637 [Dactylellina haptotyla CBS 200.50]
MGGTRSQALHMRPKISACIRKGVLLIPTDSAAEHRRKGFFPRAPVLLLIPSIPVAFFDAGQTITNLALDSPSRLGHSFSVVVVVIVTQQLDRAQQAKGRKKETETGGADCPSNNTHPSLCLQQQHIPPVLQLTAPHLEHLEAHPPDRWTRA